MTGLTTLELSTTRPLSITPDPLPTPNHETGQEPPAAHPDPHITPTPAQPRYDSSDEDDDTDPDSHITRSLERDALAYEQATISIHLQLLPHDHHPDGRPIILAVRSHQLPPLMQTCRAAALLPLPDALEDLLAKWKNHYPAALDTRQRTREEERVHAQAKEEKRQREADRKKAELKSRPGTKPPKPTTPTPSTPSTPLPSPTPVTSAQPPQSTLF